VPNAAWCKGLALVGLLWTAQAKAQAESRDDYALAPLQHGSMLSVWGSKPVEPGRYALGLGLQVRPLLVADRTETSAVENAGSISALELLATIGLWYSLDVSAGITAHSGNLDGSESRDAAPSQVAFGDVRLIPRLRLLGGDSGAGLALAIPVWIPAGSASVYRAQGLRFEPRALVSYFGKRVTLSANTGYLFSRPDEGLRQVSKDAITGSIGADVAVLDSWSVVTELSSRWHLHRVSAEDSARLPMEARAGVRFSIASWVVQLGGGLGLRGGASQPDWRLLAAVGFNAPEFQRRDAAAAPSDRDGDGIPDKSDPCPDEAEARRGASDVDGCPLEPSEHAELAAEPPIEVGREAPSAEYPVEVAIADASLLQIREVLYFELNKMGLEPAQLAVLDLVELHLRLAPADTQLVIEGHSDSLGPPSFNSSLSRMRASAVRLYLIQRGISWRRLQIAGHGSSRPVELDIDEAGRARNRRVEFRLTRTFQPQL
jgi:outer membrane protein OmpA-like peptidoglycan-associated protein